MPFLYISLKLINGCYNGIFIHKAPTAQLKRWLNTNQSTPAKYKNVSARNIRIPFLTTVLSVVCKISPVWKGEGAPAHGRGLELGDL